MPTCFRNIKDSKLPNYSKKLEIKRVVKSTNLTVCQKKTLQTLILLKKYLKSQKKIQTKIVILRNRLQSNDLTNIKKKIIILTSIKTREKKHKISLFKTILRKIFKATWRISDLFQIHS